MARTYVRFIDNKFGADANARAGNNADSGRDDLLAGDTGYVAGQGAKQTYEELYLNVLPNAAANTQIDLCDGGGFSHATFGRINNTNSIAKIISITRIGNEATATVARAHNMEVGSVDAPIIKGVEQVEYTGMATLTAVTATTFSWTVPGTPATPATPERFTSAVTNNAGYVIGATVINLVQVVKSFTTTTKVMFAGDPNLYTIVNELTDDGALTITPGLIQAIPASNVIIDLVNDMTFDGGGIVIKRYVSQTFTPAIANIKPYVAYSNSTQRQHSFDTSTASEGITWDGIHYKYTGAPTTGACDCFFFGVTEAESMTITNCTIDGYVINIYPGGSTQTRVGARRFRVTNCSIINAIRQGIYGYMIDGSEISYVVADNNGNNGATGGDFLLHNFYFSGLSNAKVSNCTLTRSAHNLAGQATGVSFVIHGFSYNYIISDNDISELIGENSGGAFGLSINNGYGTERSPEIFSHGIVERNKFTNMGNTGVDFNSNLHLLFQNNLIINNLGAANGRGLDLSQENNLGYDPTNRDIRILNNSFIGDFQTILRLRFGTEIKAYGNVAYTKNTGTVNFLEAPLSITDNTNYTGIDNNDFYAPNASTVQWEDIRNLSHAAWLTANGNIFDVNSLLVDPLFVNVATGSEDLRLQAASPVENQGHVTESAIEDYLKVVRGANPDMGAFETSAGVLSILIGGTAINASEVTIVTSGAISTLTISNGTWIAAGAAFDAQRQPLINRCTSATNEQFGWNNEVRDKTPVTAVVRTSDEVITITWPASPPYQITSDDGAVQIDVPDELIA